MRCQHSGEENVLRALELVEGMLRLGHEEGTFEPRENEGGSAFAVQSREELSFLNRGSQTAGNGGLKLIVNLDQA